MWTVTPLTRDPLTIFAIAAMSSLKGPLTPSRSQNDVSKEAFKITSSAFKEELHGEIKTTIRAEIQPLVERLDCVEHQNQVMSALKTKMADVDTSVEFLSHRIDDVYSASLPALATHMEKVATALALQTSREHLDIADAAASDFAACHRLSRKADSGVIMWFCIYPNKYAHLASVDS